MIANVIVDVAHHQVDKPFDYVVKHNQEKRVKIGMRVKVPFGPRFVMGYVVGLSQISDYDALKEINEIIDDEPILSLELIQLGMNLQLQNTAPLVTMYHAMIPSALKGQYKKTVVIDQPHKLSEPIQQIVHHETRVPYTDLIEYENDIARLKRNGVLHIEYDVSTKDYTKHHTRIELIDDTLSLRGKKQKAVITYLQSHNHALRKAIMEEVEASYSTIRSLEEKGMIRLYEKEFYRKLNHSFTQEKQQVTLSVDQKRVYDTVLGCLDDYALHLFHGVTGSGKTELYLRLIETVLKQGKDAIVLVPEISLTPQMVARFNGWFSEDVAVLHSGLSIGEKYDEWRKMKQGDVHICVGARSAVFAPFENLGIIVIDEEHAQSYYQSESPRYHAIDVAKQRAAHYNIPLILGSATPSIETYHKAMQNEYIYHELPKRIHDTALPHVYIEDMRKEFEEGNISIFSKRLYQEIEATLQHNKQVLLLLNRRGHSSFVMCRMCGEVIECPSCDISLTYHEDSNSLQCHYCGHKEKNPSICPSCGSKHIRYMGIGTEQIEDIVRSEFEDASIVRMDYDTTRFKNAHEELLYEFDLHGDILIGTEMISKGLDFEGVALVGVLAADMSLQLPDYKAIEHTFQLLTQVAGRSGRRQEQGTVVIQTYEPTHYAIEFAKYHDYKGFYEKELEIRSIAGYQPIKQMVQIVVSHESEATVREISYKFRACMKNQLKTESFSLLGPVFPKVARIQNEYRMQMIIKYDEIKRLDKVLKRCYKTYQSKARIAIDYHPTLL